MAYTKHEFKSDETLYAAQLNEMDEQIAKNEEELVKVSEEKADKFTVGPGLQMDGEVLGVKPDDDLIAHVEVEGEDEYSILIDKDISGNTFDLVKASIYYESPVNANSENLGSAVVILNKIDGQNSTDRIATISYGIPVVNTRRISYGDIVIIGDAVIGAFGTAENFNDTVSYIYSSTNNGLGLKEFVIKGSNPRPFVKGTKIWIYGKRR